MLENTVYIPIPANSPYHVNSTTPIEVKQNLLQPADVERVVREKLVFSTIPSLRTVKRMEESIEALERSQALDIRTREAIDFAKKVLQEKLTAASLPTIPIERMKAIPLAGTTYERIRAALSGNSEEKTLGFVSDLSHLAFVRDDGTLPRYLIATIALHELIHSWCDAKVRVFSVTPGNNASFLHYEGRRVGLQQFHQKDSSRGLLLNELGNCLFESNLNDELLLGGRSDLFKHELSVRDKQFARYCQDHNFEGDFSHIAYDYAEGIGRVHLQTKLIHFDLNGNDLTANAPHIILQQLASNLSSLVARKNPEGAQQLATSWLRAKHYPQEQHRLARLLDDAVYPGYFTKLKSTPHTPQHMAKLVDEAQSLLGIRSFL